MTSFVYNGFQKEIDAMCDPCPLQEIENMLLSAFLKLLREEISPEKYMAAMDQIEALIALAKSTARLRTLRDVKGMMKEENNASERDSV